MLEVLPKPQLGRLFGCKTINQISVVLEWFYDEQLPMAANLARAELSGVKLGSVVRCEIVAVTRVALVGKFMINALDKQLPSVKGASAGLVRRVGTDMAVAE